MDFAPPGSQSFLRTPFRHSSYISQSLGSANKCEMSSLSARLFQDTPSNKTLPEEDLTTVTHEFLLEDDPGIAACRQLFTEFTLSLREHATQQHIFELLARYELSCGAVVARLWKLINKAGPVHGKLLRTVEVLSLIESEQQTWRLIVSLYRDRIDSNQQFGQTPLLPLLGCHVSEKDLTDALFADDTSLRQAQLVIDWLEFNAEKQLEDHYNKVEFSMDKMGAWENTLHILKQHQAANYKMELRNIVNRLDPDATVRQGKQLLDLDEEDDERLLHFIYCCIRAGRTDEAYKVCCKVGQMWRAATLEGWRLYHDPNVAQLGPGGTVLGVEGNPFRDIWKRSCWKFSEDDKVSLIERAIYAALSGNLAQLLPVCRSWHDQLWAYLRVFVDQRVQQHLSTHFIGPRPLVPLTHSDRGLSFESIFAEIQASPVEDVRRQACFRYNLIQKHIILGDISGLLEVMHEWCSSSDDSRPHPHLLRFMAHLVLFFRTLQLCEKEELCDSVLQAYILLLVEEQETDLIAIYVSKLPPALQSTAYAKFLEGINGTAERKHCLDLAREYGLDVPIIVKLVVESIRDMDSDEFFMNTDVCGETSTNTVDELKIGAIEWLTFDPSMRCEALRQTNAIARFFLIRRKLEACRKAMLQLPHDSIGAIINTWRAKAGEAELPAEQANAVREHLCIKAYLDVDESFSDWFKHYHRAKPTSPTSTLGANFSERVAFEHLEQQYKQELSRWQHMLEDQTQVTVEKIYNVLLFTNGGWMIDQALAAGDVDATRVHQMTVLRETCLPSLCLILHNVLHTTRQYRACIQLADYIASEQHQLYKVFRAEELQKFMKNLHSSSIALLDDGQDPLGYSLNE